MPCKCASRAQTFQPIPTNGKLAENLDLSFDEIASILASDAPSIAYCYVVRSIGNENGRMVQRGSGPNIQGGYITLCTCKRRMRTYRSVEHWRNVWIVGMAGAEAQATHAIFYMMKVLAAFESHRDLFYSNILPQKTKHAKAANTHRLGDIYQPIDEYGDPFDPDTYIPPIENHSHSPDEWHYDINYFNARTSHYAALLVGDPEHSFLWEVPRILPRFDLGVGQKKIALNEFERWFKEA